MFYGAILLLQSLQKVPDVAESCSHQLIPLFLNYVGYDDGNISSQVETRTLQEIKEVLKYATKNKRTLTRIMLDNMVAPLRNGDIDVSMLKNVVQLINGRFETEELQLEEMANTCGIHQPLIFMMFSVSLWAFSQDIFCIWGIKRHRSMNVFVCGSGKAGLGRPKRATYL